MSLAWVVKDRNTVLHTRSFLSGLTCLLSLTPVFLALSGYGVGELSEPKEVGSTGWWEMGDNIAIGAFL